MEQTAPGKRIVITMSTAQTQENISRKPLRLWPGVAIVVLQWLIRFGVPFAFPDKMPYGVLAAIAGLLAIILWWLFFSRAPWMDRLGAIVVMIAAYFATFRLAHVSIATGAQGFLFAVLVSPVLSLAFVASAVAGRSYESEA